MKAELTVIASVKSINSSKLERQNYQQEMKQRNALYVFFLYFGDKGAILYL